MAELTVSRLAREVGMTPDGLRYYERAGLVPRPARTATGYRLYDDAMADRLRFIKGAQRLGLRLREIKELLDVLDRGLCPCGHTEVMLGGNKWTFVAAHRAATVAAQTTSATAENRRTLEPGD